VANWQIPLADITVDDELRRAADEAVASGWWSMGPRVSELEEAFAAETGAGHAIAVASGTAALHLALVAAGVERGDEVVVTSLNFVAAANTILHAGATPVFCDIVGAEDLNADPADVEAALTPRTKAVVALHYGGHPCAIDRIAGLAAARGIAVIEDAAHAPGGRYRGQACGTLGDVGCFSFFSNKNLPTGEGGMVTTNDSELAARIRLLRSHGMTTLTWDRHRGHADTYDVVAAGFNYRLDELRAAIGLVQLSRLARENEARGRLAALYARRLSGEAGIVVPFSSPAPDAEPAHHLSVIVLPTPEDRDRAREALRAARIQTSVHYPPIHRFSFYRPLGTRRLPRTDDVADRLLTLPLYGHLPEEDVDRVCEVVLGSLRGV